MRENYLKSFMTLILLLCVNIVNAQFDCAVGTNNGKEGHDAFLQGGIYYKPRVTDEEWEYIDEDRTDTRITKHICYIAAVGVSDDVTHVYIPDSIYVNNKYVKVHGTEYSLDYRFEGNKNITSVHFAEGVDYTHVYSFQGCSNLRELTIPSTLRTNTQSFSGTAIEKLTLNWAVSELNGLNIYPTDLLKELILGDKVTAIADNGFRGSSLRSVVIGKNVKIYQGVTLGALSPRKGQSLAGVKRHPTVCDNVTIYSGASILGGDTVIGEGAVIGGNSFITESVGENTRVSVKQPELIIR